MIGYRRSRTVQATDARTWNLNRGPQYHMRQVSFGGFEHDVSGGGDLLVFGFLIVFWCVVFGLYFFSEAHVPLYFLIFPGLMVIVGIIRWWATLPWLVTAETKGPPREEWSGVSRGPGRAREAMRLAERDLRTSGTPGRKDGLLECRVNEGAAKILDWPDSNKKDDTGDRGAGDGRGGSGQQR